MRPTLPILLACALALAGCGPSEPTTPVGVSSAVPEGTVELSLETTDGRTVEVADQRGGLLLLFVLATWDGVSQAAMRPVARFTRAHMDTVVLGVVVQPDAQTFATMLAETFVPPYTIVFDPRDTVGRGLSDLGPLEAVPSFYMIDASGHIVARHVGVIAERDLDAMYQTALARGGVTSGGDTSATEAPTEREPLTEE